MIRAQIIAPVVLAITASAALAADQAPSFQPGQWSFEITQDGSASYKDGSQKDGNGRITQDAPKQTGSICIKPDDARLLPELFAPACRISNASYGPVSMRAEISCGDLSLPMTGSLNMALYEDGKTISGTQVMSGGAETVGAVIVANIRMKYQGACNGK
ncbi:DUF3617 domain-containing protein [Sphingorhabdus arenilitoris]|uniref:DUF3617 domain-containing protein n=1 Tax=Sphingorhabdus arenilitoris TaxID=1490041 RepID=A0ABV8RFA7_9SPHN